VRTLRLAILFLSLATLPSGCYAYRPAPVAPVAGSRVRIVLTSESPVVVMTMGRADTRRSIPAVLEVSGVMQASAADTVVVRLGQLRTAAGAAAAVAGDVALVPAALISRIEERRFQAGTTLLAGAGFAVIATGVLMVLLIATLVTAAR
jgi:hypothetical protein